MTELLNISIETISINGGTQARTEINQSIVSEYAEALKHGATFPPVVVFEDGASIWLADGFHRFHAHKAAGLTEIDCDLRTGTQREAVLFSLSANASHGLRRTNEDKRKAVMTLLNDAEWSAWSARNIANVCGVSSTFVDGIKSSLQTVCSDKKAEVTYTAKSGAISTMNTANIGKNVATPKPEEHKKPAPVVNPVAYAMPGDVEEFPSDDLDLAQICQDLEKERDAALELVKRYENTDVKKVVADFDGLHNRLLCETAEKNEWIKKYNFQSELLKKIRSFVGAESNSEILTKLGKS